MSKRVAALLTNEDDTNNITGIIDALAELLRRDDKVQVAYLCNEAVTQIARLPSEGAYCGYRNIQVICLAVQNIAPIQSRDVLKRKLTIPRVQTMIDDIYASGLYAHVSNKLDTVAGTKTYIGTPEAEAIMLHLGVPCTGHVLQGPHAWKQVLDIAEHYFAPADTDVTSENRIYITDLPPIFLQRPNHSITVIGFERTAKARRLLVLDPGLRVPSVMRNGRVTEMNSIGRWWILSRYRKTETYLKRYKAFELLTIDHPS